MRTVLDTSVLIAIAKGEPEPHAWVETLATAGEEGELVICDVVASEFFALLLDETRFTESLQSLGIAFDLTHIGAAQLAGRLFREYRREGGPREHLIPDFLIGARAQQQADRIAAIDPGYLRRYFPRLKILQPR